MPRNSGDGPIADSPPFAQRPRPARAIYGTLGPVVGPDRSSKLDRPATCIHLDPVLVNRVLAGNRPAMDHEDTAMKFTTNEAPIDRIIRIVAGIGLAAFALAGTVTAPLLYVVWLVAAILLVTGIIGFCPLYALLHIGTKRAAH